MLPRPIFTGTPNVKLQGRGAVQHLGHWKSVLALSTRTELEKKAVQLLVQNESLKAREESHKSENKELKAELQRLTDEVDDDTMEGSEGSVNSENSSECDSQEDSTAYERSVEEIEHMEQVIFELELANANYVERVANLERGNNTKATQLRRLKKKSAPSCNDLDGDGEGELWPQQYLVGLIFVR